MLDSKKLKELRIFSRTIRMETIKCMGSIGVGHIGGSLSISDLLAVLYGVQMNYNPNNPHWEQRDRLVVSKGHSGPAVYSALALSGFFNPSELYTLNKPGTNLPSHCDRNKTPGIDMSTGSLGQGASVAAGIALGLKMIESDSYVYLIMGDGELQEGQVWEMSLFAAHRKLNNLIAFVDRNQLQIDGNTEDVCALNSIEDKFNAFGWFVQTVQDGHDIASINNAIDTAKEQNNRPSVIILHTKKGVGWSKSEGRVDYHNRALSQEDVAEAVQEIEMEIRQIAEE